MSQSTINVIRPIPTTDLVREQIDLIYNDTKLIIAGSLGRTAAMGGTTEYWYRAHGQVRDIDTYDPRHETDPDTLASLDGNPLPIDVVGDRWLEICGNTARLSLPRDRNIYVEMPASYFDPTEVSLLGVKVRTLRPEILFGLNLAIPYDRLRQRSAIQGFQSWALAQKGFNMSMVDPFREMARIITDQRPDYVRYLRTKDLVNQLPTPLFMTVRSVYAFMKSMKKSS